jgi:hypothetical protein
VAAVGVAKDALGCGVYCPLEPGAVLVGLLDLGLSPSPHSVIKLGIVTLLFLNKSVNDSFNGDPSNLNFTFSACFFKRITLQHNSVGVFKCCCCKYEP